MPAIIGYLVAGIILANYWVGESAETESIISILSSMGLVLLMFCIGMELNLKKLKKAGAFAVMVALIQIPLMVSGGYIFGLFMGWDPITSILFGAIISGSSTAVVTTVLKDQGKLSKEDIETIVLITVVEDVAQVVILSMASPLLTGSAMELESLVWMVMIILLFMIAAVSIGILFVPRGYPLRSPRTGLDRGKDAERDPVGDIGGIEFCDGPDVGVDRNVHGNWRVPYGGGRIPSLLTEYDRARHNADERYFHGDVLHFGRLGDISAGAHR